MRISDWSSERVLFRSEAEGTGIIFGRKSGTQADEIVLAVQSRLELIVERFISHAEAAGDGKTFGVSQRFLERPASALVLIVAFGPSRCGYARYRDGGQQKKTSQDRKSTRLNPSHYSASRMR